MKLQLLKESFDKFLTQEVGVNGIKIILSPEEIKEVQKILAGQAELGDNDALWDKLFNYYSEQGMPYGTQKARTGDPHEYVFQQLQKDFTAKTPGSAQFAYTKVRPKMQEDHQESLSDGMKNMSVGELLSLLEHSEDYKELYSELESYLKTVDDESEDGGEHEYDEYDGQPDDHQENSDFAQDDDNANASASDMYEAKKSKKPLLKKGKFEKFEKKDDKKKDDKKKPAFLKKFDKKGKK